MQKALYDSKNVSLLHFYICVLHHSFILYADKSSEISLFIIKRREDFFPFVKKQASPNANSETSENKNPTPYKKKKKYNPYGPCIDNTDERHVSFIRLSLLKLAISFLRIKDERTHL